MTVRTAYVGTEAVGDVLTKANFDKLPGGWIGEALVTASQASITAETDLTNLTVTVTAGANRRLKISATVPVQNSTPNVQMILSIKEGATYLQQGALIVAGTSVYETIHVEVDLTPTTGSHTYKLALQAAAGTGAMAATANHPAFLLVEDIGPAS